MITRDELLDLRAARICRALGLVTRDETEWLEQRERDGFTYLTISGGITLEVYRSGVRGPASVVIDPDDDAPVVLA